MLQLLLGQVILSWNTYLRCSIANGDDEYALVEPSVAVRPTARWYLVPASAAKKKDRCAKHMLQNCVFATGTYPSLPDIHKHHPIPSRKALISKKQAQPRRLIQSFQPVL
jgi:hypothetical protein